MWTKRLARFNQVSGTDSRTTPCIVQHRLYFRWKSWKSCKSWTSRKDLLFYYNFFSIFINIEQWQVSVECKRSLLKLLQDFEEKSVLGYVIISVQVHLCKIIVSLKQSVQKWILYPINILGSDAIIFIHFQVEGAFYLSTWHIIKKVISFFLFMHILLARGYPAFSSVKTVLFKVVTKRYPFE